MDNFFEIKYCNDSVIIKKNGISFSVEKGPDGDIWFNSLDSNIELPISYYSRNQDEFQSYIIFEYLMKSIVGRYLLSGDSEDEYSFLPKDFIDLENKIITWHSDTERDNILQLQFRDREIVVSVVKNNDSKNKNSYNSIKVRIRTSGSDYGYYYQEFERFYSELSRFAYQIESSKKQNILTSDKTSPTKKLSLFDKFKK